MNDNQGKPYVLVVEDVEKNAQIVINLVEEMDFDAKWASGVPEAVEMIGTQIPELIVTDLTMPYIDGYEFLKMLKHNEITKKIPVIVVSGLDESKDKQKAFQLGAVDYIEKPFNWMELNASISTHVKISQMRRELEEHNKKLNIIVKEQFRQIEEEQKHILVALAKVVKYIQHDTEYDRIDELAKNVQILGQSLSLLPEYEGYISADYIETIYVATMLHNIGKINSDTYVEGDEDGHSERGAIMLEGIYKECSENKFLDMAIKMTRFHHKDFATGDKESGIAGKQLPLSARILKIVNDYEDKTYGAQKDNYPDKEAVFADMREFSGIKYDPEILSVFFKVVNQFH